MKKVSKKKIEKNVDNFMCWFEGFHLGRIKGMEKAIHLICEATSKKYDLSIDAGDLIYELKKDMIDIRKGLKEHYEKKEKKKK